jgi:hypothetical protein
MTTETIRKDRDFNLRMEETKLKEWEILRSNIKKLRKELLEVEDE